MKIFSLVDLGNRYRSVVPYLIWITATTGFMTGCLSTPPALQPPSQMPSYRELVARYNARIAPIERFWSRAVVELQWKDEKGTHYEQGDGNLIIILPDLVALSLGKLGHTGMWAGCDKLRYWLFDLRKDPELLIGTHRRLGQTESHRWPLPVVPLQLPGLLGLSPIQPVAAGVQPAVEWDNGTFVIEPPGQNQRLRIDPETGRPAEIELLSNTGESQVSCRISRWRRMMITEMPPGAFPWVGTRLEVSLSNQEGTMTLFLADVSDGRSEDRIKERAFDVQHLVKAFKPIRVIDLDE